MEPTKWPSSGGGRREGEKSRKRDGSSGADRDAREKSVAESNAGKELRARCCLY